MNADLASRTQADATAFYTERYEAGYMQQWPSRKLARVAAFVEKQQLPPAGTFLDFGCGTGVFTELLQGLLPQWQASGVDIVDVALRKARERAPAARFCSIEELGDHARFDLVFSHHVLEHVGVEVWVLDALLGRRRRVHHY